MLERTQLVDQILECQAIIDRWIDDDNAETVPWMGREEAAITQGIYDAWVVLQALVGTDDVEVSARELVLKTDDFLDELERFQKEDNPNPGGPTSLWNCWRQCRAFCDPQPVYPQPEPMAELAAMGTTNEQIAKMYGWWTSAGNPDVNKVTQERAKPGTHYNPETWVSPVQKRQEKKLAEAWERRSGRRTQRNEHLAALRANEPKTPIRPPIAPESLEDLIRQGVGSDQIARMKQIDPQTVKDTAAQLGLPIDGQAPPPIQSTAQLLEARRKEEQARIETAQRIAQERAAAKDTTRPTDNDEAGTATGEINTYPELENHKEQIKQMAMDGCSNTQILNGLNDQHAGLSMNSVRQIAARVRKEMGATTAEG